MKINQGMRKIFALKPILRLNTFIFNIQLGRLGEEIFSSIFLVVTHQ